MPEVDFDCEDRSFHLHDWLVFWDSTRSWLAERGYTLFGYGYHWGKKYACDVTYLVPKLNSASVSDAKHPFSKFGGDEEGIPVPTLSACVMPRIAFAQDSLQRHVALRLIKKNSHQHQIAQLLSKESSLLSLEGFEGVLPPLDLLDIGNHCIMVTPRWGERAVSPWFSTIGEALDYMHYWLKGLSYLHKNHIVHRDIRTSSILVNHFGAFSDVHTNHLRRTLRRDGHLVYAIIGFGISRIFPPTATREECRLPSNLSFDGRRNQPHDTRQGELDYDPFAFDVGCLGVLFCEQFQHFTGTVPMFAPLMDRMTTRDLSRRFTASQALEFLEGFASKLTNEQLQHPSPPQTPTVVHYEDFDRWRELPEQFIKDWGRFHEQRPTVVPYEDFDRWKGLPEQFIKDWGHFREPRPSFQIRLLRKVCDYAWGRAFVQWVRRHIGFEGISLKIIQAFTKTK